MRALILTFLFSCLLHPLSIFSQRCATNDLLLQYEGQNPGTMQRMKLIQQHNQQWIKEHGSEPRSIVTIPVVVHVVYNTANQNISDDQIQSQIEVLNEDYRRHNLDTVNTPETFQPLGADCLIEFCLAATDADGNPTTGITRTPTNVIVFNVGDQVKTASSGGADGWDGNSYLNIWVCNLESPLLGSRRQNFCTTRW